MRRCRERHACSSSPWSTSVPLGGDRPAGFSGSADVWREDEENFGLWELTAWIWEHNPKGLFEHLNPRVP